MSSFDLRGRAEKTGYSQRVSRSQAIRYGIRGSVSGVAKVEFLRALPVEESSVSQDFWPTYEEPIASCWT